MLHRLCLYIACALAVVAYRATLRGDEPAQRFEKEIAPLLLKNCIECHQVSQASGGLDLSSEAGLNAGGDSGAVIDRRALSASRLLERVQAGEMPPEKNGQAQSLSSVEQQQLRGWIDAGALWPAGRKLDAYERTSEKRAGRDWWSLQPLKRPAFHIDSQAAVSATSAIDALWLRRLTSEPGELTPAVPADRAVLLRRISYDLLGLPPSSQAMAEFVEDTQPDALERIVDRYLASPRFGERWARYWLDVVRYAETNGYERDAVKPQAWRYRDWVIAALNNDLPYDRFVTEQLAGDELPDRSESTVVATGFMRLGTWDDEPNDPQEYQYDRLEDMVHATTTAFLGLTVKCARCHDHKFDPIPQQDYYRIGAAFWAGPVAHRKREWNGGPTRDELGYDVMGWTDLSNRPGELRLLKKGDVNRPAEVVAAGTLTAISTLPYKFHEPASTAPTSQRRWQLAQWITDLRNPLPARVMVNRLWQHLLGEGLVRSPDNFGFQGQPPTHAELLDWLAIEFQENGWQVKRMLRQIVLSDVYQQSSLHLDAERLEAIDPGNKLLWRANRKRLDAEALRDSILNVSGRLDLRSGGESFRAAINPEALEGLSMKSSAYEASPAAESMRRSIYMYVKRGLAVPLMTVFDCCDTTAPAGRRDVTIVATQALTLMNNPAVMQESRALAQRLVATVAEPTARVQAAWHTVLGRAARDEEVETALAHTRQAAQRGDSEQAAWAALCHVLINTNEFIFVD